MESIKTKHTAAIAEGQEEYNTVHGTFHEADVEGLGKVKVVTVAFKFSPEELNQIVDNEGVFYYTQLLGNSMMRPILIHPTNPLPEELR